MTTFKLDTKGGEVLPALEGLFRSVLERDEIHAVLVPRRLPMNNMVMPTLVSRPEQLAGIDPLSPAFPMNAAKIVSKLTRKPMGAKVAAVLRPCEIRAFVELVKLHQGAGDELVIIGMDCLGAYQNTDYFEAAGRDSAKLTRTFFKTALAHDPAARADERLAPACKACEHPIPARADILIGFYGMNISDHLLVDAMTPEGEALSAGLGLPAMPAPAAREDCIHRLLEERAGFRDGMFDKTRQETDTLEKLTAYLGHCINCYNCRVACPVCYCKECVFVTDVFDHEPSQYLNWARRKGGIKMPTDTVFYHLTRLAHMSTACVGCGQCSNACPNNIPVMELFRLVAHRTQKEFNYEPGRDPEEKPPLSEFREDEFQDVVGIH